MDHAQVSVDLLKMVWVLLFIYNFTYGLTVLDRCLAREVHRQGFSPVTSEAFNKLPLTLFLVVVKYSESDSEHGE